MKVAQDEIDSLLELESRMQLDSQHGRYPAARTFMIEMMVRASLGSARMGDIADTFDDVDHSALRDHPLERALTFDVLAHKYQLSGSFTRNACLRAAFLAAQEETSLHQHHLERAVALEFAELGKLSTTDTIA